MLSGHVASDMGVMQPASVNTDAGNFGPVVAYGDATWQSGLGLSRAMEGPSGVEILIGFIADDQPKQRQSNARVSASKDFVEDISAQGGDSSS